MIFRYTYRQALACSGALAPRVYLPSLRLPHIARLYLAPCPIRSPSRSLALNRGIENP